MSSTITYKPLRPYQIQTIRRLWESRKATQAQLAKRYQRSQAAISNIINRKNYKAA